jgi:hypothetical protein
MFAGVLGGLALAASSTAAPTRVLRSCGKTVFHNVILESNLNCPDETAIIVGAPGITINLNHHTITNVEPSEDDPDADDSLPFGRDIGIDNSHGFNNVTVENGRITAFDIGIDFQKTTGGKISGVTSDGDGLEGIFFGSSHHGLITGSAFDRNDDYGVELFDNSDVTVRATKANNNGIDGVFDFNSKDTLDGVKMKRNGPTVSGPGSSGEGDGFFVVEPDRGYLVENSKAIHNFNNGFEIEDNSPTRLFQVTLVRNTAKFNGFLTFDPPGYAVGWGYFAGHMTRGDKSNAAQGNDTGKCHNVPCHG